jgi:hypothetical protein
MKIRAKCVNINCPAYGIEKSVMLETYAGQGAPNERIICRNCQQLMRTTRTLSQKVKATSKTRIFYKTSGTTEPKRTRKKPASKKSPTRKYIGTKRG